MYHSFRCDAEGVAATRGLPHKTISEKSSKKDLEEYTKSTGRVYE
jgi:hypothetical protein